MHFHERPQAGQGGAAEGTHAPARGAGSRRSLAVRSHRHTRLGPWAVAGSCAVFLPRPRGRGGGWAPQARGPGRGVRACSDYTVTHAPRLPAVREGSWPLLLTSPRGAWGGGGGGEGPQPQTRAWPSAHGERGSGDTPEGGGRLGGSEL